MPLFSRRPKTPKSRSTSQSPGPASRIPKPDEPPPALPPIHFPKPLNGNTEDLDMAKQLDGAFQAIGDAGEDVQDYKGSRSLKVLNITSTAVNSIQTNVASAQSYSSPMKTVYESDAMKTIREGVNTLVDSLPGIVKALDEVAKIHPFIGIAVGAFRVVVELDMKRRDNDKKIGVLFVEMRDLMEALLQLRGIKDEESVGPDGQTIKARLQELVKQIAEDIKTCANACDTYAKKKLIVKVIKGSIWDGTLSGFIDLFAKRRKAVTFALSIHIGVGVDDANRRLKAIDAKIDMVLDFFSKAISPEQLELAALVQKKGGPTVVMADNVALKELMKFRPAVASDQTKQGTGKDVGEHNSHSEGDDLAVVKQELFDSPELAIKKNLEVFERKFKMQQRELAEEMRRMVHHEGDRVIEAITSGPHDRIIDPDIHEIWKDMRWPGHVKARHFVLALRDFYRQQAEKKRKTHAHGEAPVSRVADKDEWALEWININRLQAIAEAFDDDASGFITIAEVNQFTASRPKGWSLPHWLAYWAIGWQMTATKYRDMMVEIFAKMFAIRPQVHPANRNAVDKYLRTVWRKLSTLTSSLVTTYQSDALQERFKSYVEEEEQRLREGLETVKYDIDAMDTLLLTTGPGRIEKYLFPLLWLLLHRDFEIFRLCRTTVIHKDELWDSADTIVWVFDAITDRHNDLLASFKQQKLDATEQFKVFASELFDYWHDSEKFWSLDNLRTLEFMEVEYDDSKEDQDVDVNKLLNYPSAGADLYPPCVEDPITENDAAADDAVRLILGRWNGFLISEGDIITSMYTFCFHASMDHKTYEASANGANGTDYNLIGDYTTKDDGTVEYNISRSYIARFRKSYWTGRLEDDGETLSGRWGYEKDDQPYTFLFKRVPPEVLVDRPHPKEFKENRIRALWKYALTVVRNDVRRKMFSWSYIKERRDLRLEYLKLAQKEEEGILTSEDVERFGVLDQRSTFNDVRCFYVLQDIRQRSVIEHFGVICDHCGEPILGTRIVCMECGSRFTFDFCDKLACVGCTIKTRDDFTTPHLPTHDFVKIRTAILHYREIGKVLRSAKAGLERAKRLLEEAKQRKDEESEEDDKDEPTNLPETKVVPAPLRRVTTTMSTDSASEGEVVVPRCIKCAAVVSMPCLYCIDCPETVNAFICSECDEQHAGFFHDEHHLATHNLVVCKTQDDSTSDETSKAQERLAALESKMSELTSQLDRMEKLLQSFAIVRTE
ncbi:hypothetical protein BD310DRAFT_934540 [Dichomitus squalens]|uniref:Uncharacterized protein n=1 Tax=Dichomitus squalens TaxID=114155 RepID=A0A4V2K778_9APHY|nr:hypothetical protein BD310DRAFT_934540 [Dichomitus squalens]